MATTTFIDYKDDKGFWIFEPEMELVFYFIHQTFQRLKPDVAFGKELEAYLDGAIRGHYQGMLVLDWNTFLKTAHQEKQMIRVLHETIGDLHKKGDYLSVEELSQTRSLMPKGYEVVWEQPIKISEVTKVIAALIRMLKGEWDSTNYDMKFES